MNGVESDVRLSQQTIFALWRHRYTIVSNVEVTLSFRVKDL